MKLSAIIKHLRDREYMSGIERDNTRILQTQEIFTPTPMVQAILDELPQDELFNKNTVDNSCGDGQFLSEVLIRKLLKGRKEADITVTDEEFLQALSQVYGVDLMPDNVAECRKRLLCGRTDPEAVAIVNNNIVEHNGLTHQFPGETEEFGNGLFEAI